MSNSEFIRYKIRQIIREGIAHILMSKVLDDGRINLLSHSTLYGAPYSTKPFVLRNYIVKKEMQFEIELRHLFNDNVILHEDKKSQELIAYLKNGGKQIFTLKLSSDRLKPSFIRFDCLPGKEKIKIPVTISEEEVERIILDHREKIIDAGFKNIFNHLYIQVPENSSTESIEDFYKEIGKETKL